MPYKTHVFICTNSPDNPDKCGFKGAEKLRQGIKEKCQSLYSAGEVRINSSGCLGHCEKGIAAVVYPKGDWHFCLTEKDEEKILDAVKAARDSETHK